MVKRGEIELADRRAADRQTLPARSSPPFGIGTKAINSSRQRREPTVREKGEEVVISSGQKWSCFPERTPPF